MTLDAIEYFKVNVRFLKSEEGGRRGPLHCQFAAYGPDFTMNGKDFHGAVFMDAPSGIAPGDRVDVEIAFWRCDSHHSFTPGDIFYLHEGRRIAEGTISEKGVKQYVRPDRP